VGVLFRDNVGWCSEFVSCLQLRRPLNRPPLRVGLRWSSALSPCTDALARQRTCALILSSTSALFAALHPFSRLLPRPCSFPPTLLWRLNPRARFCQTCCCLRLPARRVSQSLRGLDAPPADWPSLTPCDRRAACLFRRLRQWQRTFRRHLTPLLPRHHAAFSGHLTRIYLTKRCVPVTCGRISVQAPGVASLDTLADPTRHARGEDAIVAACANWHTMPPAVLCLLAGEHGAGSRSGNAPLSRSACDARRRVQLPAMEYRSAARVTAAPAAWSRPRARPHVDTRITRRPTTGRRSLPVSS
jgi:hypothetical protein